MGLSIESLADGVRIHLGPLQGKTWSDEYRLQDAAGVLLEQRGEVSKEHRLSDRDRVDFMLADGLAVEVTVGGSASDVTRQLHRYLEHEEVSAVILLTTRSRHRVCSGELNGKPVFVLWLRTL